MPAVHTTTRRLFIVVLATLALAAVAQDVRHARL